MKVEKEELFSSVNESPDDSVTGANKTPNNKFSPDETQLLKESFRRNPYPKRQDLTQLAEKLGRPYRVVAVWFTNRRVRARKETTAGGGGDGSTMLLQDMAPLIQGRQKRSTAPPRLSSSRKLDMDAKDEGRVRKNKILKEVFKVKNSPLTIRCGCDKKNCGSHSRRGCNRGGVSRTATANNPDSNSSLAKSSSTAAGSSCTSSSTMPLRTMGRIEAAFLAKVRGFKGVKKEEEPDQDDDKVQDGEGGAEEEEEEEDECRACAGMQTNLLALQREHTQLRAVVQATTSSLEGLYRDMFYRNRALVFSAAWTPPQQPPPRPPPFFNSPTGGLRPPSGMWAAAAAPPFSSPASLLQPPFYCSPPSPFFPSRSPLPPPPPFPPFTAAVPWALPRPWASTNDYFNSGDWAGSAAYGHERDAGMMAGRADTPDDSTSRMDSRHSLLNPNFSPISSKDSLRCWPEEGGDHTDVEDQVEAATSIAGERQPVETAANSVTTDGFDEMKTAVGSTEQLQAALAAAAHNSPPTAAAAITSTSSPAAVD